MLVVGLLFGIVLMSGCSDYRVEEESICIQYKAMYKCKDGQFSTLAICDTKEECNKICKEIREDKRPH